MRVTLGEEGDNQPPPSHAWSSLLIVVMLQEGLKEQITEAVVLDPGEVILFFGLWSCQEGLPLGSARDEEFSLMSLTSWAGRVAQVKGTVNTVQEGHCAIAEAIVEKRTKAMGARTSPQNDKVNQNPCHCIWYPRVDAGSRRGCSWKGGKKGWCS